jgi:hypothetical protein
MEVYFERAKRRARLLTPALAAGGEAEIFAVEGDDSTAVKAFHERFRTPEKEDKVAQMLARPASDPRILYPTDRVRTAGRRFLGYAMRRVRIATLLELLNPAARALKGVRDDFPTRLRTAAAVADVVSAAHAAGLVIGDVSASNFGAELDDCGELPDEPAVVALDCDSYQLKGRDIRTGLPRVFRCGVGTDEFTPPELQGKDLRGIDRTPEQDRFGTAVLLWSLVKSDHPFSARDTGGGTSPQELPAWIRRGLFPHAPASPLPRGWEPVDAGRPFASLPAKLRALFCRAFHDGHADPAARPAADEWVSPLLDWADAEEYAEVLKRPFLGPLLAPAPVRRVVRVVRRRMTALQKRLAQWSNRVGLKHLAAWVKMPAFWYRVGGAFLILCGLTLAPRTPWSSAPPPQPARKGQPEAAFTRWLSGPVGEPPPPKANPERWQHAPREWQEALND